MNNFYLTKLIKEYYDLPKGYIIDNPNSLNFICKIFNICDVYISNKALKHIVESRRDKDKKGIENIIKTMNTTPMQSIEVSHGANFVCPCTKAEPWGIYR